MHLARSRTALSAIALILLVSCGPEPPAASRADSRPNVLVVVMDAARRDHFGFYGYERDTTPNLDRFVQDAAVFEDAVSEAAFTFASVSSLMLGQPPGQTGLLGPRSIRRFGPTLAQRARASGYRTFAYSENPFISVDLGFNAGFDTFHEGFRQVTPVAGGTLDAHVEDSETVLDDALTWMAASDQPFLAYVHLFRPHSPYAPTGSFLGRFGPVRPSITGSTDELFEIDAGERAIDPLDRTALVDRYDENLAQADSQFGHLWSGLQRTGLADDTIVVFLSDHGEAFGEHGRWLHNTTVFDEMVRVPLVIRHPWRPVGRRVRGIAQLVDVHATLLELMNVESRAFGRSLLPELLGEREDLESLGSSWTTATLARVGVRSLDRKVIGSSRFGSEDDVAGYDLEEDPGELSPIDPSEETFRALLQELDRQRQGVRARGTLASPSDDIDPELLDRLRALGYLR